VTRFSWLALRDPSSTRFLTGPRQVCDRRYLHTTKTFTTIDSKRLRVATDCFLDHRSTHIYLIQTIFSMPQVMDEETPLLAEQSQNSQQNNPKRQKTPLPWRQLSILLLLSISEPITSQVIAPFLPQVRIRHCKFLMRTRASSCVVDKGYWYH